MAADPKPIYWDSCVFIDGLRQTPVRWPHIQTLEHQAKGGALVIYTSALAIAEVVKTKESGELTDSERHLINAYFRHKFVRVIPVDRIVAKMAAEIVRNHELKPPDAIHVASAIRTKCVVMYTYDGLGGDPDKLLGKSGQIGAPSLPIKLPGDSSEYTMFASGPLA